MKTVLINCSPRKRFCASSYFLFLQSLFIGGEKVKERLHSPADHARILEQLRDARAVVFGLPLYVDGVPSHVLRFLQEMEAFCRENGLKLRVYCIANNGFIEGKQNEPLMQVFENFCARAGLVWGGGVGIGGGVMLNVTRILFVVEIALLVLNSVLLFYLSGMGRAIRKETAFGKKYTRILIPSFVFILFADVFFTIISLLQGGVFRGWLAKKE